MVGTSVGPVLGRPDGDWVGFLVGTCVGVSLGLVYVAVGWFVGSSVSSVGRLDGASVGRLEGSRVRSSIGVGRWLGFQPIKW